MKYQKPNTNIRVFHNDTLFSSKCVPSFHGLQFPSLSMLILAVKGLSTLLFLCLETNTSDTNILVSGEEATGRWRRGESV